MRFSRWLKITIITKRIPHTPYVACLVQKKIKAIHFPRKWSWSFLATDIKDKRRSGGPVGSYVKFSISTHPIQGEQKYSKSFHATENKDKPRNDVSFGSYADFPLIIYFTVYANTVQRARVAAIQNQTKRSYTHLHYSCLSFGRIGPNGWYLKILSKLRNPLGECNAT